MSNFKVCLMDYEGKKKWYDLTQFEDWSDFRNAINKDFGEDSDPEVIHGGILNGYIDSITSACWKVMELEEEQLELLITMLKHSNMSLDEAIQKIQDEEYQIYSYDYNGFLDDDEVIGYQLLDELGADEVVKMALEYGFEEQIARLVGEAIIDNARDVIKTDNMNEVILLT